MSSPRSAQDGQRLTCPRCQANNFVGQAKCWQCQSPLSAGTPAPHLTAPALPHAASPAPVWDSSPPVSASQRSHAPGKAQGSLIARAPSRPVLWGVLAGVALLAFTLVFKFAGSPPTAPALPPPASESRSLLPDSPSVIPQTEDADSRTDSADSDPILDAGKRALEREKRHLDLPSSDGVVSSDGRVHLRSGGSISPEEWKEAQRKLKDSPVLRDPPSPPPF